MQEQKYYYLVKDEIIQLGDEVEISSDPWRDKPLWKPAGNIGEPAPDPAFPSHRQYRRPIIESKKGPNQ